MGKKSEKDVDLKIIRVCLVCAAFCASTRVSALSERVGLDWDSLEKGEIIILQVENKERTPGLLCYFLVTGEMDRLFDTLRDPDFFKSTYGSIEQLNVVRTYEGGADLECVMNATIRKVQYVVSRRYDKTTHTVLWHRISGDLKDVSGSWTVEDGRSPGKCLIVYESYVDPGEVVNVGLYAFFARLQAYNNLKRLRTILENGR